ncbi:MAG: hypothetical protein OXF50_11850 [Caldilineaceae bacterium]|nr:hypothetical protein [Caldilineaceae bacterium]
MAEKGQSGPYAAQFRTRDPPLSPRLNPAAHRHTRQGDERGTDKRRRGRPGRHPGRGARLFESFDFVARWYTDAHKREPNTAKVSQINACFIQGREYFSNGSALATWGRWAALRKVQALVGVEPTTNDQVVTDTISGLARQASTPRPRWRGWGRVFSGIRDGWGWRGVWLRQGFFGHSGRVGMARRMAAAGFFRAFGTGGDGAAYGCGRCADA